MEEGTPDTPSARYTIYGTPNQQIIWPALIMHIFAMAFLCSFIIICRHGIPRSPSSIFLIHCLLALHKWESKDLFTRPNILCPIRSEKKSPPAGKRQSRVHDKPNDQILIVAGRLIPSTGIIATANSSNKNAMARPGKFHQKCQRVIDRSIPILFHRIEPASAVLCGRRRRMNWKRIPYRHTSSLGKRQFYGPSPLAECQDSSLLRG